VEDAYSGSGSHCLIQEQSHSFLKQVHVKGHSGFLRFAVVHDKDDHDLILSLLGEVITDFGRQVEGAKFDHRKN